MENNSLENTLDNRETESNYRALRDSVLQIYQFATRLSKDSSADNEVQISWDLGDTSLIDWISFSRCYLSRPGHKLQFLSKPSRLETIGFDLLEKDKLLICSDALREHLSDNEIDEILRESQGVESSCKNLLRIAYASNSTSNYNVVVMEVVNSKKVNLEPVKSKKTASESGKSAGKILFPLLGLLLFIGIGALIYWIINKNEFSKSQTFASTNTTENLPKDTIINYIPKDSIEIASEMLAKEFDEEKKKIQSDNSNLSEETTSSTNTVTTPKKEASKPESEPPKTKAASKPADDFNNFRSTPERESNPEKTVTFDRKREEQNLISLKAQQEKWKAIRDSLQKEVNEGNLAAKDQLKNSIEVLERVEKKIRISTQKLQ